MNKTKDKLENIIKVAKDYSERITSSFERTYFIEMILQPLIKYSKLTKK